ncbi:MAG: leucine-rich repeat protein [Clostridia bacterium]|nr:leucine-rich repeat protein [Clostridia bacterium]
MKKQFILILTIMAMLACIFAISASADTIVPATTNEYGELTVFDEAIGNTNISQSKDDGEIARTVLFDGTNYYTVPTTYILTESTKSGGEMFNLNFSEINEKLVKSFSKSSIIRSEIPSGIAFVTHQNEGYSGCSNMIEITINEGLRFWDDNSNRKIFMNCSSLKSIDLSKMVLNYAQTTASMFEGCSELEYIKLPDAYAPNGTPLNYNVSFMFKDCKKLKTIENAKGFYKGVTTFGESAFLNCYELESSTLQQILDSSKVASVSQYAFKNCSKLTEIILPNTLTNLANHVFNGSPLTKVVFPTGIESVGNYCFEGCTTLTDVWMPSEACSFGQSVFGKCGSSKNINFYFTTATSTITLTNETNSNDPFITALNTEGDTRIQYNTPLSTKCTVFLGGHTNTTNGIAYENGFDMAGKLTCICSLCQTQSTSECAPMISILGYLVDEKDGRITVTSGFTVDTKLVELYNSLNKVSLEIGVLFANAEELSTAPTNLESIKHFTNGGAAYSTYNYIVTFPSGDTGYANAEFIVNAFIYDATSYKFFSNNSESTTVTKLESGFTTTTLNKIQEATQVTEPAQQNEALEVACINAPVYAMAKSNDELYAYIKESYRV